MSPSRAPSRGRPRQRARTAVPTRGSGPSKSRGARSARGRWLLGVALAAVCLFTAAAVVLFGVWQWGRQAPAGEGFVAIEVSEAEPLEVLAARLEAAGLVTGARRFALHQRLFAGSLIYELGPHWIGRGRTPEELGLLLARRQSRRVVKLNLPEGWDSFQMAARLEELGICSGAAFSTAVQDQERAERAIGRASFEGYLYPATYAFSENTEPAAVVSRLVKEARTRFQPLLSSDGVRPRAGLTPDEVVTLASIVQKEAVDEAEMPSVAAVFFNRLEDPDFRPRRMLQSDPTAGYGCKLPEAPPSCAGFSGRITPELLRDEQNPYNTYRQPGLPPGPIGNPSVAAVQAVLGAPRSEFYYFVRGPDGRHAFSVTYEEHQKRTRATR